MTERENEIMKLKKKIEKKADLGDDVRKELDTLYIENRILLEEEK